MFSYEQIEYNRKNVQLLYHNRELGYFKRKTKNGTIEYYFCPIDYVVLLRVENGRGEITLEGADKWYSRETCPLHCNHYRWFIFPRKALAYKFLSLRRRATLIVTGPTIAFVLAKRRLGFRPIY